MVYETKREESGSITKNGDTSFFVSPFDIGEKFYKRESN